MYEQVEAAAALLHNLHPTELKLLTQPAAQAEATAALLIHEYLNAILVVY
jgi:hypothetical protein